MNRKTTDGKTDRNIVLPAFDRVAATTAAFYRIPLLKQPPRADRTATLLDKHLALVTEPAFGAAQSATQTARLDGASGASQVRPRRRLSCALLGRRDGLDASADYPFNA